MLLGGKCCTFGKWCQCCFHKVCAKTGWQRTQNKWYKRCWWWRCMLSLCIHALHKWRKRCTRRQCSLHMGWLSIDQRGMWYKRSKRSFPPRSKRVIDKYLQYTSRKKRKRCWTCWCSCSLHTVLLCKRHKPSIRCCYCLSMLLLDIRCSHMKRKVGKQYRSYRGKSGERTPLPHMKSKVHIPYQRMVCNIAPHIH